MCLHNEKGEMRPQSTPAGGGERRRSLVQRFSLAANFGQKREAFTTDEAKDVRATDLALRVGNKDPSLPCVEDVSAYGSISSFYLN